MGERYVLREGSRGGEREIAVSDDGRDLLELRDHLRERYSPHSRRFDVIDRDAADLGEHGFVELDEDGKPELASRLEL
jgi:hypothetical protein